MLCLTSVAAVCQFVPQPLNYPGPGYWPAYFSIIDSNHVWVGTIHESGLAFPFSAKTSDGGNTWKFDSIPVPGTPFCSSICGWDTNTCYFVFVDADTLGGMIWKTTDGGNNWNNMTTSQFAGGFANFYHAFSADTGVAMGDPTGGYFEIQITNNGGASWTRVPSANIPSPLANEAGWNDGYSYAGNSVWFSTNQGRCFRSTNKGLNWQVTDVVPGGNGMFDVCFSGDQKGVYWMQDAVTNAVAVTSDGGINWDTVSFPQGYSIMMMSAVPGFNGGFILTAFKNGTHVFFTPDLFSNLIEIESNIVSSGEISFSNAWTGWLAAGESGTNEIYRYTGILTKAEDIHKEKHPLLIIPNPSGTKALVRISAGPELAEVGLRIFDKTGKLCYNGNLRSSGGWITLDASSFPAGIYELVVSSGNEVMGAGRWIVSH
ncbi:MAG: hypothetical protein ACM3N9_01345 [Syntrophothermus sp.]